MGEFVFSDMMLNVCSRERQEDLRSLKLHADECGGTQEVDSVEL